MDYIDDYGSCEETYSTLRIYTNEKPPEYITARLGIEPSSMSFESSSKRRRKNGWYLSTESIIESKDSRRHIDWIIDRIMPKKEQIGQLLIEGCEIDISSVWHSASGNGGPTISPKQMAGLAKLNLSVWWDVWL